jgi:hypothetical protein
MRLRLPVAFFAVTVALLTTVGMNPASSTLMAADTNAYFDALIARTGFWKGYSLRPKPGFGIESPYYSKQLDSKNDGGYLRVSGTEPRFVTYDATIDAAKVVIPAWVQPGWTMTLGRPMSASDTKFYPSTWATSFGTVDRQIKIDNEVMLITGVDPSTVSPRGVLVSRGAYGTMPTSHGTTSPVYGASNSLPTQVRVPLGTEDGNTYIFTWDVMYTSSYVGTGLAGNKTFQFSSGQDAIWWEVKTRMDGGSDISKPAGFNRAVHVGGLDVRSYNRPGGDANWMLTDGSYLGPGVTENQPVAPMQSTFLLYPNRWIRYWVVVEQRANDYDYIDVWAADELTAPRQIYKRIPASTFNKGTPSINFFWLEFNDSQSRLPAGRTDDFADMVAYVRNFAALKNVSDVTPLLQRPVPGVLPGETSTAPGAPRNVRIVRS